MFPPDSMIWGYRAQNFNFGQFKRSIAKIILYHRYFISKPSHPITAQDLAYYNTYALVATVANVTVNAANNTIASRIKNNGTIPLLLMQLQIFHRTRQGQIATIIDWLIDASLSSFHEKGRWRYPLDESASA